MFMGTYYNSIDAKNRMIVPAKHRLQLGERCVLTKGLDPCLNIYSVDAWEQQMEKMEKLPESDRRIRSFIRLIYANAVECEFDKQGRIVIPAKLKEDAGITRELVTMGVMKKIEVWSREVWESPDNEGSMNTDEFAEALSKYDF
jgi:MraZ protein